MSSLGGVLKKTHVRTVSQIQVASSKKSCITNFGRKKKLQQNEAFITKNPGENKKQDFLAI